MSPGHAALANGIAAHALDFDDVGLGGHPSAAILPAVFALAEERGAGGPAVIEAAVAGYEAMGMLAGVDAHRSYLRGFHTTGTLGTVAAAAACGRLLGLGRLPMARAIGLAATQAAGLKATFGTMGKHLNAGKAAADGLLAARLAASGFTGPSGVLESDQGFFATHSGSPDGLDLDIRRDFTTPFGVETLYFKAHAACGGTHSAIATVRQLRATHRFGVEDVDAVELRVPAALPDVCGIDEPATGLEGKFSIRYAAALALAGGDTGPAGFSDERVADPVLVALRARISVVPDVALTVRAPTVVTVRLRDGRTITDCVDPRLPVSDEGLPAGWQLLVGKFLGLAAPVVGEQAATELVERVARLESEHSLTAMLELAR